MNKYIVILGVDAHSRAIGGYLSAKGFRVVTLDTRSGNWEIRGSEANLALLVSGLGYLDCLNTISIYWRSHDGVSGNTELARTNRLSLLESWLKFMEDRVVMYNGHSTWRLHQTKPYQMGIIQEILNENNLSDTISVPPTGYNESIYSFAAGGDEELVYKPAQGGAYATSNASDTPYEPAVQRLLRGETYRVYVFKDKCIAFRIKADTVDYRQDPGCRSIPTDPEDLPVKELMVLQNTLADKYAWNWSGCDLIADENGWHLLDVNPSPMFLEFEQNWEVTTALAGHLT